MTPPAPPAPAFAPLARSRVVVVADASAPIGRAVALLLAERGHAVLATGRDGQAMGDLSRETAMGGILETASLDAPLARAKALFGRVDALVVAASVHLLAPLATTAPDVLLHPVRALLTLLGEAIPHVAGGRVVLVTPPPVVPPLVSAATVRALFEALAEPLRGELAAQKTNVVTVATERGRARRAPTPAAIAEVVLKAVLAPRPKVRYTLKVGAPSA